MRSQVMTLAGGVLIGLATLTATNGLLAAQESTPTADEAGMMPMAAPATDAGTAAKMDAMMDQCLAMMKMMNSMMGMMGMMGGDMSGMTGDQDMQGMQGMDEMPAVSATPGA